MTNLLLIFGLSLLFTVLLNKPVGWRHPRAISPKMGQAFLFLLFSVTMLSVSKWILHADDTHSSLTWMASLTTGFILFLLLIAFTIPAKLMDKRHETTPGHGKSQAKMAFNISFWILLGVLIALIIL